MKKLILTFAVLILFYNHIQGQSYTEQFNDLMSARDTVAQLRFLEKWETANSNDPDLYISYFNYYYNLSIKKVVRLEKTPHGKNSYVKLDSVTKKPVGYWYVDIVFKPEVIAKGFRYIDMGIEKFPSRLDMRFAKVYAYGKMEDYDDFTKEIIRSIDYSKDIENNWTWKDGKPPVEPLTFFLNNVQNYQMQLYNTGKESLLNDMILIANEILKYYPGHAESLTNLASVYMLKKEYDSALEVLHRAEKLTPDNYIIISNLAEAYKHKGDKQNAKKYYELVIKYGDNIAKQYARDQIKGLDNK
jgi:tetratricopeptide (TPR) repeat protein